MFLKSFKDLFDFRAISSRLSWGYAFSLALGIGIFFSITYFLFVHSIRFRDHEDLKGKARSYASILAHVDSEEGHEERENLDALNKALQDGQNLAVLFGASSELAFKYIPKDLRGSESRILSDLSPHKNLAAGEIGSLSVHDDKEDDVVEFVAFPSVNGGVLFVGRSSEQREELFQRLRLVAVVVFLPLIVFSCFGFFFLSRRMLSPLRDLLATMRANLSGKRIAKVSLRGSGDELDELASVFNELTAHNNRLVEVTQTTLDHVAHDMRTPLTRIRTEAEFALREANEPVAREALMSTVDEIDEALKIFSSITEVTEAEAGATVLKKEIFNAKQLIGAVIELYAYVAEEKGVTVRERLDERMELTVDRTRFARVIANLLDNAIKYTPKGGEVFIGGAVRSDGVEISVSDNGVGIEPSDLSRIWERLFRGDKSRSTQGLGLGLSLARALVVAHGGTISVESTPGIGSRFKVLIPL